MLSRLAVPHLTEVTQAFGFRLDDATGARLLPAEPRDCPTSPPVALLFPWAVTMVALQQRAELWHSQGRQDPLCRLCHSRW